VPPIVIWLDVMPGSALRVLRAAVAVAAKATTTAAVRTLILLPI
jgi:hypothetical protein